MWLAKFIPVKRNFFLKKQILKYFLGHITLTFIALLRLFSWKAIVLRKVTLIQPAGGHGDFDFSKESLARILKEYIFSRHLKHYYWQVCTCTKYKKISNVACKAVIKPFLREIYVYVFTNKSVNSVYIPRSSFCIFVVLPCINHLKVVRYAFLVYLTFMTEVTNIWKPVHWFAEHHQRSWKS